MRKNRKRSRMMSVSASRSMHFAAVVMMLFLMVIVNMLATSRCDQMMKSIGEKREQLAKLEKDRERASGRWDQLRTDDNLDRILPKLGMSMKYPRAEQVVYMTAAGRPELGQVSVAKAERRRGTAGSMAANGRTSANGRRR